jgi:hypothetical protein
LQRCPDAPRIPRVRYRFISVEETRPMTIIELATIAMIVIYVAAILLIVAHDRRAYLKLEAVAIAESKNRET